ncbi:MAG: DegV family protein [Acutalibacteraceae bacterium]
MKTKIAITTDSAADIEKPLAKEYDIHIIPMVILSGESQFKDGIDITPNRMLQRYEETGSAPKATAVSAQEYKLVFSSLIEKGYDVIHVCPSGKLFPCYENACFAANAFSNVHVIDSGTVSAGLMLLCLEASRMRLEEKSADEIVSGIEALKKQIDTSFLAGDAQLLYKSGLCTALEKTGSSLFGFSPTIDITDGTITLGEKHKGSLESARRKFLSRKLEALGDGGSECIILSVCGIGQKETDELCTYIKEISCAKYITVTEAGCCMATYCSDGFIGLAFKREL